MTVPSLERPDANNAHAPANYEGRSPAPQLPNEGPPKFDLSTMFSSERGEGDDDEGVDENLEADLQNEGETDHEPNPTPSPSDVLLQEQLKTQQGITQALQALMQGQQQQTQPAPRAQPQPDPAQRVWINPDSIPAPMVALLQSEDPAERTKGLALFGDALVRMVYAQFQKDVTETYQPQFQGYVQDHYAQQAQAQEFRHTFERKYPMLMESDDGRMVARLLIEKTVTKLASEGVAQNQIGWGNPKFEATFNEYLKALNLPGASRGQQQQQQKPNRQQQPRGPSRASGARPNAPSGGATTQQDQMLGVLATARMGRR